MASDAETRAPRAEARLDLGALGAFLAAQAPALGQVTSVQQFARGYSNLTYLLETTAGAFVLRRAPPGVAIASAHDMGREFRVLSAVRQVYPKVPRPIVACEDPAILGSPFYVMERLAGRILRGVAPEGIERPEVMRRSASVIVETLAELHGLAIAEGPLAALGHPEGYVARQVGGWRGRWEKARLEPCAEMEDVGRWLTDHVPVSGPPALLHNDFKFDNVVLSPGLDAVVGVLDWEMATLGDPLADLGHSLAIWIEAEDPLLMQALQLGPTGAPGSLSRAEVLDLYARHSGRDVSGIAFYLALGLFKFAVVVQQLYARHVKGLSSDPRYAGLDPVMRAFAQAGAHVADTGGLRFMA